MKINTTYISNQNSYANVIPRWIVIHNTDNYKAGANARAHAMAQRAGNFDRYSAHVFVDDSSAYQATPYNRGCWHVGVNYGSHNLFGTCSNHNSVGIEMCVNAGYNYEKAFQNTVQVCRQLMQQLGIDADHVVQHYDVCTKNCPSAIRAKGDWPRFKKLIGTNQGQGSSYGQNPAKLYRVRKTWTDSKSQLGAYAVLSNAKKNCPVGYSVYDETGKVIYTNKSEPVMRKGMQATELKGLTAKELISKVGPLFTADQKKSGVLASVSMAQFILESGWGKSGLTQKANNAFGMKKNLSGNTWPNSAWDGKSVISMKTGEETDDGKAYTITAEFRKYNCIEDSISDHSAYLTGAKDGDKLRYEGLKGCKKYKQAAQIIKNGGYATSTSYVKALCDIIKEYSLTDYEVKKKATKPATATKPAATPFKVKVSADDLRIRKTPSLKGEIAGYTGKGIFTITEEKGDWGKLKSGAGWICLTVSCVKRV